MASRAGPPPHRRRHVPRVQRHQRARDPRGGARTTRARVATRTRRAPRLRLRANGQRAHACVRPDGRSSRRPERRGLRRRRLHLHDGPLPFPAPPVRRRPDVGLGGRRSARAGRIAASRGQTAHDRDALRRTELDLQRHGPPFVRRRPSFRRALDRSAAVLDPILPRPILEVLDEVASLSAMDAAAVEPALFALEWSLAELGDRGRRTGRGPRPRPRSARRGVRHRRRRSRDRPSPRCRAGRRQEVVTDPARLALDVDRLMANGCDTFVEIGRARRSPARFGGTMRSCGCRRSLRDRNEVEQMLESLGALYIRGVIPRGRRSSKARTGSGSSCRPTRSRGRVLELHPRRLERHGPSIERTSRRSGPPRAARAQRLTRTQAGQITRRLRDLLGKALDRQPDSIASDANLLAEGLDSLQVMELIGGRADLRRRVRRLRFLFTTDVLEGFATFLARQDRSDETERPRLPPASPLVTRSARVSHADVLHASGRRPGDGLPAPSRAARQRPPTLRRPVAGVGYPATREHQSLAGMGDRLRHAQSRARDRMAHTACSAGRWAGSSLTRWRSSWSVVARRSSSLA